MKPIAALLCLLAAGTCLADVGKPQSRLELQSSKEREDIYNATLRRVFKRAYEKEADGILGNKGTVVGVMGDLVRALAGYTYSHVSEDYLKKALRRVEAKKA